MGDAARTLTPAEEGVLKRLRTICKSLDAITEISNESESWHAKADERKSFWTVLRKFLGLKEEL